MVLSLSSFTAAMTFGGLVVGLSRHLMKMHRRVTVFAGHVFLPCLCLTTPAGWGEQAAPPAYLAAAAAPAPFVEMG
jgi:hypothetical protein